MKSFAFVLVVLAVFYQNTNAQCLPFASNIIGPMCGNSPVLSSMPATIVQPNSVANSLADTLSLLTVSSLLSETLPMNPNVIATMPISTAVPVAVGGCGCGGYGGYSACGGCGGYNSCGCGYNTYYI